jgi:hypothetical protein
METSTTTFSARPFREILRLWMKIFQMDDAFFAAEAPRTSSLNTLYTVLIAAVAGLVLSIFVSFSAQATSRILFQQNLNQFPSMLGGLICGLPIVLVFSVLNFYIGVGLQQIAALILRGKGSYSTLAYLGSLFLVPVTVITGVVSLIPCLGPVIGLIFQIYAIILSVRTLRVTHQFSTGRAWGAYFLVYAFLVVVIGCLACAVTVPLLLGVGG